MRSPACGRASIPAQLASEEGFRADPARVWAWYAERRDGVRAAQPNAGHVALGDFARRRPGVLTLVSQNVDDLHQRAGNTDTIRLHGDIMADHWLEPCARRPACEPRDAQPGQPPRCAQCGNLLRPGVVWFGEMLPPAALQAAERRGRTLRRGSDRRHVGRGMAGGGSGRDGATRRRLRGHRQSARERDRRSGPRGAARHRSASAAAAASQKLEPAR